jgi:hypothetical protein
MDQVRGAACASHPKQRLLRDAQPKAAGEESLIMVPAQRLPYLQTRRRHFSECFDLVANAPSVELANIMSIYQNLLRIFNAMLFTL